MNPFPNIYFVCVHKGASTFVACNLFSSITCRCKHYSMYHVGREYIDWYLANRHELNLAPTNDETELTRRLGLMFETRPLPRSGGLIGRLYPNQIPAICGHLNENFPPSNSKVFVMRRDPRDALVSLYYSKAYSHAERAMLPSANTDAIRSSRTRMREMGIYNWIEKSLTDPDNKEVVDEFTYCANILSDNCEVVDLPYELLITEPRSWLETFVHSAGLEKIVGEAWYNEMAKHLTPPDTEDRNVHKRRVTPGNWKEVFDDNLSSLMKQRIGQEMEKLQYNWD